MFEPGTPVTCIEPSSFTTRGKERTRAIGRPRVSIKCCHCFKEFYSRPCAKRKFCSDECYQKHERPTSELFWKKVSITGPDECWEWMASKNAAGYGHFRSRSIKGGSAHRASYILTHGEIPQGQYVMHSCDNPACVNPAHLSLGTHLDNIADMYNKGRGYWQKKTHCPQGHEYAGDNLGILYRGNGGCFRKCKACIKENSKINQRKYREKKRQAKINSNANV